MDKNDLYNLLLKEIPKSNILLSEPMYKHTSFKTGGNADFFIKCDNISDIRYILRLSNIYNIPIFVLGNGTNLLVKDNGIRGIVLQPNFNNVEVNIINSNKVIVTVGASVLLGKLSFLLCKDSILGLEFATGIPGTIAGAVKQNAGAYGKEMKDIVYSSTYIDYDGNLLTIENEQHEFEYRNSFFSKQKGIIIEVKLALEVGNQEEIKQKIQEYSALRKEKQPTLPSAGSTFKRGKDFITAKLIDECGLKGFTIGDAQVSTKHAGFIVNKGSAKAKDIIEVIDHIKQEVLNKFDKEIELEVEIIGED